MSIIATTRFTNDTWDENIAWRENKDCVDPCVYGTHICINEKAEYGAQLFVLEMNNDINEIVGIGKIRNKIQVGMSKRDRKIYEDSFYCKYVYKGKHHINRHELTEREKIIIQILDIILFKGSGHFKRGQGITIMSEKKLQARCNDIDFIYELNHMFNRRFA